MSFTDHITALNWLIEKYQYKTYLEIGTADDACFKQIKAAFKTGVDPVSGGTVRLTSDVFFEQYLHPDFKFDLIFIDGLHEATQVDRDIQNALKHLTPGGTIMLHDCKPISRECAAYPRPVPHTWWTGDVWKAIAEWRTHLEVDMCTIDFDWGCGLLKARPNQNPWILPEGVKYTKLPWEYFEEHKEKLLDLKTPREAVDWL